MALRFENGEQSSYELPQLPETEFSVLVENLADLPLDVLDAYGDVAYPYDSPDEYNPNKIDIEATCPPQILDWYRPLEESPLRWRGVKRWSGYRDLATIELDEEVEPPVLLVTINLVKSGIKFSGWARDSLIHRLNDLNFKLGKLRKEWDYSEFPPEAHDARVVEDLRDLLDAGDCNIFLEFQAAFNPKSHQFLSGSIFWGISRHADTITNPASSV